MLAGFLVECPNVELQVEATNRRVDVIGEGIDIAVRVRPMPIEDSGLMLKVLAEAGHALVASPGLPARYHSVSAPADLAGLPSLDLGPAGSSTSGSFGGRTARRRPCRIIRVW